MKKIVVFTGSGISAESGIRTFRETGGLWEEYDIMQVATPEAWKKDPDLVTEFYNKRRKQCLEAEPNAAHISLANLEGKYDVQIITQNIDDLHERAGSTKVLHLHGEIRKAKSSLDHSLIYEVDGWELTKENKCSKGSRLRPHVVWFGEAVPEMERAYLMASKADIFIVVGTSLNVYPAAGLVDFAPAHAEKYLIDPHPVLYNLNGFRLIQAKAGEGVPVLVKELMSKDI